MYPSGESAVNFQALEAFCSCARSFRRQWRWRWPTKTNKPPSLGDQHLLHGCFCRLAEVHCIASILQTSAGNRHRHQLERSSSPLPLAERTTRQTCAGFTCIQGSSPYDDNNLPGSRHMRSHRSAGMSVRRIYSPATPRWAIIQETRFIPRIRE